MIFVNWQYLGIFTEGLGIKRQYLGKSVLHRINNDNLLTWPSGQLRLGFSGFA